MTRPLMAQTVVPIVVKDRDDTPEPDVPVYYLLASNGLFLCRNRPFFRSCSPARSGPGELLAQEPFLEPRYPLIPAHLMERIVGFFAVIADRYRTEAGALLLWDQTEQRVDVLVPEQTASAAHLHYKIPRDLGGRMLLGDVHSHVDGPARASHVDEHDEDHSPGLHLIVGRVRQEPPDLHVEAVVDGARWVVDPRQVIGGEYRQRDVGFDQLEEWVAQVHVEPLSANYGAYGASWGGNGGGAPCGFWPPSTPGGRTHRGGR